VALHRAGAPVRDRAGEILTVDGEPWRDGGDEARIVWRAGVGTRASAIVSCLATTNGEHPLIAELLAGAEADASEAIVVPLGGGADALPNGPDAHTPVRVPRMLTAPRTNGAGSHDGDHETDAVTVTVPLRITVRQGNGATHVPAVGVNFS
jgi:hypothetical protein